MTRPDTEAEKVRVEQDSRIHRQIAFASGIFQNDITIRTLLESLPEGVVIIDSSGTILLTNARANQMFGYLAGDLTGKPHTLLIPASFRKIHEEHLSNFIAEPRIRPMGLLLDLTGLRQDGSEFPVEISLSFIETINGAFILAFISDITIRKEFETRIQESTQDLQDTYRKLEMQSAETIRALEEVQERDLMLIQQNRMAAMGELIMNIAHHWRQPLNLLALIVQEQAVQHRQESVSQEKFAANTKKAMEVIGNMSRTIDNFGNFFRPDDELVSFRVNGVLTKVIAMIGGSLKELQVSTEVTDQGDLVINGYQNEFAQVLINIMLNARDAFLEQAVIEPRITIRMSREGERGVVSIADNAGGIPEAIIGRIFDPYFTTRGPDKGTGIGLYMAKTLIERHMNGSLTVRNKGDGAEFRIEV
jgi:PAS domain S-box-containing protein